MLWDLTGKFINIKRFILTISFILIAALISFYFWMQDQYVVPILTYHSVSTKNTNPISLIDRPFNVKCNLNVVSVEAFARQMDFLKNHRYKVISLENYVQGKKARNKFSHNVVVITFDDGYRDNYENAFPILKEHHFPATVFLISDAVGKNSGILTWDQVKEMSQSGITFGSHTRHHVYMPNQSQEIMKDELIESKHEIENNLGQSANFFAYPIGGFSEQIKVFVALAGYKAAFTTNRGNDRYNIDLYEQHRIHINNWDNPLTFSAKLSGYYNFFRALKPSH